MNKSTLLLASLLILLCGTFTFAGKTLTPPSTNETLSVQSDSIPIGIHYKGGTPALKTDIHNNLVYPPDAKRNRIQGTCIIHVTLEEDGTLTNMKIVKEKGAHTGKAALDVVKTLKFKAPGYRAQYQIPVKFKL